MDCIDISYDISLRDIFYLNTPFLLLSCSEEQESNSRGRRGTIQNKFVPASQNVVACAAHPLNGTIIAGTKVRLHKSMLSR